MGTLAALVLATPLFGFQLTAPLLDDAGAMPPALIQPMIAMQLDAGAPAQPDPAAQVDPAAPGDPAQPAPAEPAATPAAEDPAPAADADADAEAEVLSPEDAAAEAEAEEYGRLLRERQSVATIHRAFGISTWASMTVTVALGIIQYYNQYGFFSGRDTNPCVEGSAIFGQDQCYGSPLPHALAATATSGLYYTTFVLSLLMPDPDNSDEGDSDFARTLRRHKLLRWVHFWGMAAQGLLGPIIANSAQWLGLQRANDYGTLQALATVHLGLGLITYAALTWAGALMVF
jgi:hypothetical protein